MTKVVHCKKEPYDIYIGRPGPLGNPFIVGQDGTRAEVIAKHMEMLRNYDQDKLLEVLKKLVGKTLGCWCKPLDCHGDNFIQLIKEKGLE